MRERYHQDRRFGVHTLPAAIVAIGALLADLPAWGQPPQTSPQTAQTSANKPLPDPVPVQTPPAPSPDYTLTTKEITIQYKTKRAKGAKCTDLVYAGVSPAEVSIKCTKDGVGQKVSFKVFFYIDTKGPNDDYPTDVVTSGDDGICKIPMKQVAESILADLNGLLPSGFDPACALSLGNTAKVTIKLITPPTNRVVVDAGKAADEARQDAADALKKGAADALDRIKTFADKAKVYDAAKEAAKAADPKTGDPVSITNGDLLIKLRPGSRDRRPVMPRVISHGAGETSCCSWIFKRVMNHPAATAAPSRGDFPDSA